MKKLFLSITAVILFMLLFSTKSFANDWTTYKSNSQNNPVTFDPAQYKYSPSYSLPSADVQTPFGYPVASNGVLYYSKNFGNPQISELYAVNINSGNLIWKNTYSNPIYNLSIYNNKLYFGADKIYCLNLADGSEIWVASAGLIQNPIYFPYVYTVYRGVVLAKESYSNFINKSFLALNAENGQIITNMSRYDMTEASGIIANDQTFYISHRNNYNGRINAFDINSFTMTWRGELCLNGDQPTIDPESNRIYLLGSTKICVIDSTNGKKLFNESYHLDFGLAKYGDRMRGFFGNSSTSFAVGDDRAVMDYGAIFTWPEKFVSPPLIVNDTIYGGSNKGRIWSRNLETGEEKISTIGDADDWVHHMIYANGKIVAITRNDRIGSNLRVIDRESLSVPANNYTVTLESPYNTDGYNQYLGQLHAHYLPEAPEKWALTYGDYLYSPYDVEKRYKDAGYDFIALTEHNQITSDPGVEGMLHINNSEEDTQTFGGNHILALGINSLIDESQNEQKRVDQVLSQSGVPILAHPNQIFYRWSDDSILSLRGINLIEGFNSAVSRGIPSADALDKLDKFSYKLFATAGDDFTPDLPGFDGGAVVVFSKTKSQSDIMQNLKDGNFYALQGSQAPRINVSTSENTITVNSDRQSTIKFIGKGGKTLQEFKNVNSASYVASGDEIYVRAEVEANGKTAWTQPIKVNKTRNAQTISAGMHYTDLGQAKLLSNSNTSVNATILSASEYPSQSPPLGYLSQIYSFATSGQILEGTKLSISYADRNISTNANNLAIFTFNEATSLWDKVTSFVDLSNKTVSANLSHFSLYTLSAEQPTDNEKPAILLESPSDTANLSGNFEFVANASDNNAVTEVRFFIDDKLIFKDTDTSDGWRVWICSNDYSMGDHQLKLEAEDFAGNVGEFETNFTIADSTFISPTISLTAPAVEQYLKGNFVVSGSYSNQNEVKNISVFLNDIYLSDADISAGNFQKEIDFNQFKEGKHQLKIVLTDKKDNVVETATLINVGDELKVNIVSPQNKTYFHSETILFQFKSIPENAEGVTTKLDGVEIANNATKNAYDLSLGQHRYSVEKNGKVYAEQDFIISTSLIDLIKLTEIMYKTGHIKNHGITTAIQAQLVLAQLFDSLGMKNLRNITIQKTIKYIEQQNKQKKPLVDNYYCKIITEDLKFLFLK